MSLARPCQMTTAGLACLLRVAGFVVLALALVSLERPLEAAATQSSQSPGAWREHRSRYARVAGTVSDDELRHVASLVDLTLSECQLRFAAVAARVPEQPRVVACATEAELARYLAQRGVPAPSTGEAARFHGTEGATVAFQLEGAPWSATARVIRREVARMFLHERFAARVPEWLVQGVGELFCDAPIIDGKIAIGSVTRGPIELVRATIDAGSEIAPERIFGMDRATWETNAKGGGGKAQSAQALSMTRFLLCVEGARQPAAMDAYFRAIRDGIPQSDALRRAFGATAATDFSKAWRAWALQTSASPEAEAALRLEFLSEGLATLAAFDPSVFRTNADDETPRRTEAAWMEFVLGRLAAREFRWPLATCGLGRVIDANDAAFLASDDHTRMTFALVVAERSRARLGTATQLPTAQTVGLGSRELDVRWLKAPKSTSDSTSSPKDGAARDRMLRFALVSMRAKREE
jgi:hypothetical protein